MVAGAISVSMSYRKGDTNNDRKYRFRDKESGH